MDERELRVAMCEEVAVPPPPMSDAPVLTAAHRALGRRRAVWASAGSAAAVALVAVGVAVLAPSQSDDGGVQIGTQPPTSTAEGKTLAPSAPANATATEGPNYDSGVALAAALDDLAPEGYDTPALEGVGDFTGRALKTHVAMWVGDGVWNYAAGTPLTKGEGVGELIATVFSPGGASTGEGCALTPTAWDAIVADCTEVLVDGAKVAVADIPAADGLPAAQWAGYRHADGTVVFVMQAAEMPRSGRPALTAMPMTDQQLAALATNPRLEPQ